ncbi:LacI family DNA-binding transcriptional regulator [Gaetbulibacter jejuensis]|uniref:HTH lacI-type domain-containing protein n=1 Tax=Gaetbulibacter jejuensis TaxID=584607 RepID=A0ABN1JIV8_9FLAO
MMTLKQISHITGFSTSTVSKALNDRFDINVETKKLIQDIALKNNYVPNKNAIALRKSKSNIVAVILPQVNDKWYSDTLYEIQKTVSKAGYRVMLFQSFDDTSKEDTYLDEINDGSIDAAIVLSANNNIKKNKFTVMPIAFVQITKEQSAQELIQLSVNSFKTLLERI